VVEEDEESFAQAAAAVLRDRDRARQMGEQGLQWARQWSSVALAGRMAELYRSLVGGQSPAGAA
jgi:glycosyltransferase involved in cell wall biosynthesis